MLQHPSWAYPETIPQPCQLYQTSDTHLSLLSKKQHSFPAFHQIVSEP
uniref:Uncharacterized protein n=1 Tax=Rhizophora mucronata TaxID=61149 RepID=A0A2P2NZ11_RHIMU